MAGFDYAGLAAEVTPLIEEFGTSVVLRRTRKFGGSPADPLSGETTTQLFDFVGVEDKKQIRDRDGNLTGEIVSVMYLNAGSTTPTDNDEIAFGVTSSQIEAYTPWRAIEVATPIAPAGVAVLHELRLQGGDGGLTADNRPRTVYYGAYDGETITVAELGEFNAYKFTDSYLSETVDATGNEPDGKYVYHITPFEAPTLFEIDDVAVLTVSETLTIEVDGLDTEHTVTRTVGVFNDGNLNLKVM